MWKSLGCGVFVLALLAGCSTADVTGDESMRQYGDTVFTNHGSGSQTINIKLYGASNKETAQTTDNDPSTSVDPNISVGLNGGTSSLAADGGKMLLEGITSMIEAGVKTEAPTPEPPVVTPDPPVETPPVVDPTTEVLRYNGRANGDRPTWYGENNFNQYSSPMRVVIQGCYDDVVIHDGVRYEKDGLILKQSDVAGRGMGVVYSATCKSETATVEY